MFILPLTEKTTTTSKTYLNGGDSKCNMKESKDMYGQNRRVLYNIRPEIPTPTRMLVEEFENSSIRKPTQPIPFVYIFFLERSSPTYYLVKAI